MLNWPRIRCALTRHGRIGRYEEADLTVYVCERCGQLVGARTANMGFIDKVHFPGMYPDELELEGVWQEWGKTWARILLSMSS